MILHFRNRNEKFNAQRICLWSFRNVCSFIKTRRSHLNMYFRTNKSSWNLIIYLIVYNFYVFISNYVCICCARIVKFYCLDNAQSWKKRFFCLYICNYWSWSIVANYWTWSDRQKSWLKVVDNKKIYRVSRLPKLYVNLFISYCK